MLPDKAEWDQSIASLRDYIPRAWWAVYEGSIQAGFTQDQAFALVTTYILKDGTVRPDNQGRSDKAGGDE